MFFANRSVCYTKLEKYPEAILDAQESIDLDPNYIKGYNRLATAYRKAGDLQKAIDLFQQVVDRSEPNSSSARHCQKQIAELKQQMAGNTGAPRAPSSGAPGGLDLGSLGGLLGGLGQGGPGGLNIGELLKNPQLQQMAQQFMSNPEAMGQMQSMMQDPNMMGKMAEMMGGDKNLSDLAGKMAQQDPEMLSKLQATMSDPVKRKDVMEKVMADPETQQLRSDPEVGGVLDRLQAQDMSALTELMGKPDVFAKFQVIIQKYL